MFWKKSIVNKVIIGIIIPILLILLLAGVFVIVKTHSALISAADRDLEAHSDVTALEIDKFFIKYIEITQQLAHNIQSRDMFLELGEGMHAADAPSHLKAVETFDNIQAADANIPLVWTADFDSGESIRSGSVVRGLPDYDITERSWYLEMVENQALTITEPYLDTDSQVMVTSVMMPVWNDSDLLGLVALDITMSDLSRIMSEHKVGESGYIILVSSMGTIVYHPNGELIETPFADSELDATIKEAVVAKAEGEYTFREGGVKMRGILTPILDTGWMMITAVPERELLASYNSVRNVILITFGIGIIGLITVCLRISLAIVEPIRKLSQVTKQLSEGDLDITVDIATEDETGLLGRHIVALVTRLKDYILYINEINDTLNQIADGDLTFELTQKYEGEFSAIKDSFLNLRSKLSEILNLINISSGEITQSTVHVADSAQVISGGVRRQSDATGHLESTVDRIAGQIATNVDRAAQATKTAGQVSERIEEFNRQMEQMTQAMEDIKDSSNEIMKIMQAINDIANRTNTLALNASVEAARSGTAGKGFAVVATEVRNLAAQTAEAARNIASLIKNSLASVEHGAQVAENTSQSMLAIVDSANDVSVIINEISQESEKQVALIGGMRKDAVSITDVARENAEMVNSNISSSQELTEQAHALHDLVGQFNYAKK